MKIACRSAACLLAALLLAACAVGPDYVRPALQLPAGFKEDPDWKPAQPSDGRISAPWWQTFNDQDLDALVDQVAAANQDVRVAEANYRQATALARQAFAGLFPVISLNASSVRTQGASGTTASRSARPTTFDSVTLGTSWEADLWGGLRRSLEQTQASHRPVQASWPRPR